MTKIIVRQPTSPSSDSSLASPSLLSTSIPLSLSTHNIPNTLHSSIESTDTSSHRHHFYQCSRSYILESHLDVFLHFWPGQFSSRDLYTDILEFSRLTSFFETYHVDCPFCFEVTATFVPVQVHEIAETAIFVGVGPNVMFPHTSSSTRSCTIVDLQLADYHVQMVINAYHLSERLDTAYVYTCSIMSKVRCKTVQLVSVCCESAYFSIFVPVTPLRCSEKRLTWVLLKRSISLHALT